MKSVPAAEPRPSSLAPSPAPMFPISTADGLLWARLGVDRELRVRARATPGSYGVVFLAHAEGDGDVAVKGIGVLHSRNVAAVHTALSDAIERAGRIGDPAVLVPTRHGRSETAVFYVEPWIAGGSVADLMHQRKPVPLARVATLLRAVAPALDRAHEKGLVHGGIDPGNLLLDAQGRVFLADFGINAALGALPVARNPDAARAQAYTAPEQWRHGVVDGRADQYALALIAYELLTAQTRYDARGVEGVPTLDPLEITDHSPLRPELPLFVNAALRTALGAKPANRFPTVAAFVDALEGKRPGAAQGLPLVRFRIGDIKPRHVVFTLSGVMALLGIFAVGDAATHGALRAEAKQLYDRFAPDMPRVPLPTAAEGSLQSATPRASGGGITVGGGGGGVGAPFGGNRLPGGIASGPTVQPGGGSRGSNPQYGPELTGQPGAGGGARQPTFSVPSVASGKRLGSGARAPSAAEPAEDATAKKASKDDDLLPTLYGRARLAVARLFSSQKPNADSAVAGAAATAIDGAVSIDADGGPALITVDGIPMGTTPATLRLLPGNHTVSVHGARSYEPNEIVVTVTRGGTTGASFRVR